MNPYSREWYAFHRLRGNIDPGRVLCPLQRPPAPCEIRYLTPAEALRMLTMVRAVAAAHAG